MNQRKEAWRAVDELADGYKATEAEHARAREVRALLNEFWVLCW